MCQNRIRFKIVVYSTDSQYSCVQLSTLKFFDWTYYFDNEFPI